MKEYISLTKDNIKHLNPDDLIAVTIAEGGAMGDPGAIELVDKKLRIHYTHFGVFERKELEKTIPFLKAVDIGFGEVSNLSKDWDWLYTGYGNFLFIRPELKNGILEYVRTNYKKSKLPEVVELYTHWYDALKEINEVK